MNISETFLNRSKRNFLRKKPKTWHELFLSLMARCWIIPRSTNLECCSGEEGELVALQAERVPLHSHVHSLQPFTVKKAAIHSEAKWRVKDMSSLWSYKFAGLLDPFQDCFVQRVNCTFTTTLDLTLLALRLADAQTELETDNRRFSSKTTSHKAWFYTSSRGGRSRIVRDLSPNS